MARYIQVTGSGHLGKQIVSPFFTKGEKYIPVIYARDKYESDEIVDYHILFIKDIGILNPKNIPPDILTLITSMRLAFRFRYEIIEEFKPSTIRSNDIPALRNILSDINQEALVRGFLDNENLPLLFKRKDKKVIEDMVKHWKTLMTKSS